jgi:hypothetical protein
MFSLVAEIKQGRAETNCRAAVPVVAGRCGGGVPKPERLQDGDGTDDRTGWPAVIRGRHEQYRSSCSGSSVSAVRSTSSAVVSGSSVKASTAGARAGRFGSGVPSQSRCRTGDGADCRRVALFEATSSTQFPLGKRLVPEGKNGGARRHQDRPGGSLEPGYRRTSIVRWSSVKQPRSPHPREHLGRVCGNSRPTQCQGRQMV